MVEFRGFMGMGWVMHSLPQQQQADPDTRSQQEACGPDDFGKRLILKKMIVKDTDVILVDLPVQPA